MRYLIIGLGQDALLSALKLFEEGSQFKIIVRRSQSVSNKLKVFTKLTNHIQYIDNIDAAELLKIYNDFPFDEILNFAANSYVQDSKDNFATFIESNSGIVWEILKFLHIYPNVSFFHPLSSELYDKGSVDSFFPRNSYGLSKLVDYHSCRLAAEYQELKITNCVLFNHESYFRPEHFFTKKIIKALLEPKIIDLKVYNAKSQRDWGYAPEFIEMILDRDRAKGFNLYQLGTGELMSVENFIDEVLKVVKLDFSKKEKNGLIEWRSSCLNITEEVRSIKDQNRIVSANKKLVKASFGKLPKIHTKRLVSKLIKDHIK